MNQKNLRQKNVSVNTIWIWIRMINSCLDIFQGPIKSFIDVLNCLKKDPGCVFPSFSNFGCPKPVFPKIVYTGKYHSKNLVPSKTLQPCIYIYIYVCVCVSQLVGG